MATQLKIIKQIYIRKGPGTSFDHIGVASASGELITMDGKEQGEVWKGISDWYYKINEKNEKQYYWSGGCSALDNSNKLSREDYNRKIEQIDRQIQAQQTLLSNLSPVSDIGKQNMEQLKQTIAELLMNKAQYQTELFNIRN